MSSHGSPHLRGLAHQMSKKPAAKGGEFGAAKETMEKGQPGEKSMHGGAGVGEGHASEHGTQPHPKTGVHAVHIHHMGGGKAVTHTHHEDRAKGENGIETQDHDSMDDANQHAQAMLPSGDQDTNQDADVPMAEAGADDGSGMSQSLGQMT